MMHSARFVQQSKVEPRGSCAVGSLGAPNLRLHLTRLSCAVVELAGPATEVLAEGPSPEPPRR